MQDAPTRRRTTAWAVLGMAFHVVLEDGSEWPDPCSRFQPGGGRGPSRVVDTSRYEIAPGPALHRDDLVMS